MRKSRKVGQQPVCYKPEELAALETVTALFLALSEALIKHYHFLLQKIASISCVYKNIISVEQTGLPPTYFDNAASRPQRN